MIGISRINLRRIGGFRHYRYDPRRPTRRRPGMGPVPNFSQQNRMFSTDNKNLFGTELAQEALSSVLAGNKTKAVTLLEKACLDELSLCPIGIALLDHTLRIVYKEKCLEETNIYDQNKYTSSNINDLSLNLSEDVKLFLSDVVINNSFKPLNLSYYEPILKGNLNEYPDNILSILSELNVLGPIVQTPFCIGMLFHTAKVTYGSKTLLIVHDKAINTLKKHNCSTKALNELELAAAQLIDATLYRVNTNASKLQEINRILKSLDITK